MSYNGGTLTLPSPTHGHHVDVSSAVRSLRRSMSRSPSKFNLSRSPRAGPAPPPQSSESPKHPHSPLPPCRLYGGGPASPKKFFHQSPPPPSLFSASTASTSSTTPQSSTISSTSSSGNPLSSTFSASTLSASASGLSASTVGASTPSASTSASTSTSSTASASANSLKFGPNCAAAPGSTTPLGSSLTTTPARSVRLSLRSAKYAKSGQASRPLSKSRASPKSPSRRVLQASTNFGNSVSASPLPSLDPQRQESVSRFASGGPLQLVDKPSRHSLHVDVSGASQHFKALATSPEPPPPTVSPSGALKRNDVTNLDQLGQGSPVAKRRSMHGISSVMFHNHDFTIYDPSLHDDQGGSGGGDLTDSTPDRDYELAGSALPPFREPLPSPTPVQTPTRRHSSLRRSTLQQRHGDRTSWGRKSGAQQLAQLAGEVSTPVRPRPRLSLDQFVPLPVPRDSPFGGAGPLPNPSIHSLVVEKAPHPLSKTLTTSSSGNSLTETSDVRGSNIFEKPRLVSNFSKSLPYGVAPSFGPEEGDPSRRTVTTPKFDSRSQIWQGAFNSTGLISKVNRNPELLDRKPAVPDTPCKKPSAGFNTFPPQWSASAGKKNNRNSLAMLPDSPFQSNAPRSPGAFGKPAKGLGLFQRFNRPANNRRDNALDREADEPRSSFGVGDFGDDGEAGLGTLESDLDQDAAPPTPTRPSASFSTFPEEDEFDSPIASRTAPALGSVCRQPASRASSSKFSPAGPVPLGAARDQAGDPATTPVSDTPLQCGLPPHFLSITSFGQSRAVRGFATPTPSPLRTAGPAMGTTASPKALFAKVQPPPNPASPIPQKSPHTPQHDMTPPDPSTLSISNGSPGLIPPSRSEPVPVTPTTGREAAQNRLVTPANVRSHLDLDATLLSRFGKVEAIDGGEFSIVYKVSGTSSRKSLAESLSTPVRRSIFSPNSHKVYAVKKNKLPYAGTWDRTKKLQEVDVLRTLTNAHAKHVLEFIDSWEDKGHLYIQTEFCDEGSLKDFLTDVGDKGRLDDFRIWKIFHELIMGLKEIHSASFVHLDLKPANVLVTYEGVLKIADFGLTLSCPAEKDEDAEGDREYIAQQVLDGIVSQPADVFSLGLMLLEMSINSSLPQNGPLWQALRTGDASSLPSLTFAGANASYKDSTGAPVASKLFLPVEQFLSSPGHPMCGAARRGELTEAPSFVKNVHDAGSLDTIFGRMICPCPDDRPTVDELLQFSSVRWVASRRQSPATIFEGLWGPDDESIGIFGDSDTEMTDV